MLMFTNRMDDTEKPEIYWHIGWAERESSEQAMDNGDGPVSSPVHVNTYKCSWRMQ